MSDIFETKWAKFWKQSSNFISFSRSKDSKIDFSFVLFLQKDYFRSFDSTGFKSNNSILLLTLNFGCWNRSFIDKIILSKTSNYMAWHASWTALR